MKKLITYTALVAVAGLAFSGCAGNSAGLKVVEKTKTYPKITNKYRADGRFTFGEPKAVCWDSGMYDSAIIASYNMNGKDLQIADKGTKQQKDQLLKDVKQAFTEDFKYLTGWVSYNQKDLHCELVNIKKHHSAFESASDNIRKKAISVQRIDEKRQRRERMLNEVVNRYSNIFHKFTQKPANQALLKYYDHNPFVKTDGAYKLTYYYTAPFSGWGINMFVPVNPKKIYKSYELAQIGKELKDKGLLLKLEYTCSTNDEEQCMIETYKAREYDKRMLLNFVSNYELVYAWKNENGEDVNYEITQNDGKIDRKKDVELFAKLDKNYGVDERVDELTSTDRDIEILKIKKDFKEYLAKIENEKKLAKTKELQKRKAKFLRKKRAYEAKKAAEAAKKAELEKLKRELGE